MSISRWIRLALIAALAVAASLASVQNKKEIPAADVINKSIKAVGYEVGGGATKVIFLGTSAAVDRQNSVPARKFMISSEALKRLEGQYETACGVLEIRKSPWRFGLLRGVYKL